MENSIKKVDLNDFTEKYKGKVQFKPMGKSNGDLAYLPWSIVWTWFLENYDITQFQFLYKINPEHRVMEGWNTIWNKELNTYLKFGSEVILEITMQNDGSYDIDQTTTRITTKLIAMNFGFGIELWNKDWIKKYTNNQHSNSKSAYENKAGNIYGGVDLNKAQLALASWSLTLTKLKELVNTIREKQPTVQLTTETFVNTINKYYTNKGGNNV